MKIGLFFGSFNPVHIGHLAIANYMIEFTEIEQLWFVVSPQSPFKQKVSMLGAYDRVEMLHQAIGYNYTKYKVSEIELSLPQPNYTINTLVNLKEKHLNHEFFLIMGEDNLESFQKWKNWEQIIENYKLLVYKRPNCNKNTLLNHTNVTIVDAPLMEISSSFIRNSIKEKKDIRFFLPEKVFELIDKMNFYKK
jgi:nicotinate-nucleotide adenylyltransferase